MKISDILSGYSADLNDARAITWPTSRLLAWYQEGVALIGTAVPEKAYKRVIVRIQPCHAFVEVCACENIHSVIGLCDKDGRVLKRLRETPATDAVIKPPAPYTGSTDKYTPDSYALDRRLNMIQIFSPPPPKYEGYLLLECIPKQTPDVPLSSESTLSATELAIVRQWVLWSAHMVDTLDANSVRTASSHIAVFEKLLSAYAASVAKQLSKE